MTAEVGDLAAIRAAGSSLPFVPTLPSHFHFAAQRLWSLAVEEQFSFA
jgi:hypothetical protein